MTLEPAGPPTIRFGDTIAPEVLEVLVQRVCDRTSARYRLLLREGRGWEMVEQQAGLDVDADGRIAAIDLLCSGFRPADGPAGTGSTGTHAFDSRATGCTDRLASGFRRRIGAIPVGDVLAVTARDPAAREDLPPLARLMGGEESLAQGRESSAPPRWSRRPGPARGRSHSLEHGRSF